MGKSDGLMTQDNPQQTELAYYAGIVDGEGSISVSKSKEGWHKYRQTPMHYGKLAVGMTHEPTIRGLHQLFGGYVRREVRAPRFRDMWRWVCAGKEITTKALLMLYPFLRVKKRQAAAVLDLNLNWTTPVVRSKGVDPMELQRREELYTIVRKLNAVGVAATTEYQGPEKVCDSLNLQETARDRIEASCPLGV